MIDKFGYEWSLAATDPELEIAYYVCHKTGQVMIGDYGG